jgi:predicted membrane-bound spermidine synthase
MANEKVDTPVENDWIINYKNSVLKVSTIVVAYLLVLVLTKLVHRTFEGASLVFPFLYLVICIGVISGVGLFDQYAVSNIITGLSVAFGILLVDPQNFIGK